MEQLNLFGEAAEASALVVTAPADRASDDLARLEAACRACQACGLAQNRQRVVFSDGNPKAKLMLIGEGPGAQEDETGIPFVGRAGQLLDKILASVGFDRQRDVYVCNVVKCRPPGNRTPEADEIAACSKFLDAQIRLVDPRIVLLVGATAAKAVLGTTQGISRLRGVWVERENRWWMPIFHPAYLLRNDSREVGGPKWLTWQDMQQVRAKFEQLLGG